MSRWIRSPILFASALLLPVLLLWLALAPHRAPVTGEDGLKAVQIVEAAIRSAASGAVEDVVTND